MVSPWQAWRSVARRPGYACASTVTLGLGLGLTVALYAAVDAVLIRALPYPDSDRLVAVYESSPGRRDVSLIAPARLADWARLSRTLEAISGSYSQTVTDTSGGDPERLDGRCVMPRFFDVFGTRPIVGRTFVPDEERYGGAHAAVISEALWARRCSRSADLSACGLLVGGVRYPVVGVMASSFSPAPVDVWIPAQLAPALLAQREARFLGGIARMKPGVSIDAVRSDLAAVQASLGAAYPKTDAGWGADVQDLKEQRVGEYRRGLLLVLGAVLLLLAIAVANVACLTVVHLMRRGTELAVRAALGASRSRVLAAIAVELTLVAGLGLAVALGSAAAVLRAARATLSTLPRIDTAVLDWRMFAAAAGLTVIAVFVSGLVPAFFAAARIDALRSAGRGIAASRHRAQRVLVVTQIALTVMLSGTAALLVRSYASLREMNPGFNPSGVLTFHVGAAWNEDRGALGVLQRQLLDRFEAIPGVRAAGFVNFLPATGATLRSHVRVAGLAGTDADGRFTVGERSIGGDYLQAIGIPVLAGSACGRLPQQGDPVQRALVNRRFVDAYANGTNIVGRAMTIDASRTPWTIVGVIGDAAEDGPGAPDVPYVYLCLPGGSWPDPQYVIRSDRDARAVIAAVRTAVHEVAPTRPLFAVRPLDTVLDASIEQPRDNARLLSAFAAGALVVSALGLYGLLALTVHERRRELGVRAALGAAPWQIARAVLSGAAALVGSGIAAGLVLLALAGRALRGVMAGVGSGDPVAIATGVCVLAVVAASAAAVPAWRAARISAMDAMRS